MAQEQPHVERAPNAPEGKPEVTATTEQGSAATASAETADKAKQAVGQAATAVREQAGKVAASMQTAFQKGGIRGLLANNQFVVVATVALVLLALWAGGSGCPVPGDIQRQAVMGKCALPADFRAVNYYVREDGGEKIHMVDYRITLKRQEDWDEQPPDLRLTMGYVKRGKMWYWEGGFQ